MCFLFFYKNVTNVLPIKKWSCQYIKCQKKKNQPHSYDILQFNVSLTITTMLTDAEFLI